MCFFIVGASDQCATAMDPLFYPSDTESISEKDDVSEYESVNSEASAASDLESLSGINSSPEKLLLHPTSVLLTIRAPKLIQLRAS